MRPTPQGGMGREKHGGSVRPQTHVGHLDSASGVEAENHIVGASGTGEGPELHEVARGGTRAFAPDEPRGGAAAAGRVVVGADLVGRAGVTVHRREDIVVPRDGAGGHLDALASACATEHASEVVVPPGEVGGRPARHGQQVADDVVGAGVDGPAARGGRATRRGERGALLVDVVSGVHDGHAQGAVVGVAVAVPVVDLVVVGGSRVHLGVVVVAVSAGGDARRRVVITIAVQVDVGHAVGGRVRRSHTRVGELVGVVAVLVARRRGGTVPPAGVERALDVAIAVVVRLVAGQRARGAVVDLTVAQLAGAGVDRRLGVVAVGRRVRIARRLFAGRGRRTAGATITIAVRVLVPGRLIAGIVFAAGAVVIDAVAGLASRGVDGRVPVVAVGSAVAVGILSVTVGIVFRRAVAVAVDPVVPRIRGAGVDRSVPVVAVGAIITGLVDVTVLIRIGGAIAGPARAVEITAIVAVLVRAGVDLFVAIVAVVVVTHVPFRG